MIRITHEERIGISFEKNKRNRFEKYELQRMGNIVDREGFCEKYNKIREVLL